MANHFKARIRVSLADANLQAALDANAVKRIKVRREAFASLPDPQELRERAHAVRAEVIDRLESYLQQFIAHASGNGLIVHQAENASQAVRLVLEIAEHNGAKLIAKSKTMVSEEIGLNHLLEIHGLQVIETDLGEYIVQLRGETPSHIITPAVHLRRQDVGKLFEEKLGLPYTEDISLMTNVARQTLRQVFLNADIGISGVNFGIAQTGTLCVVTNEGNGRMVTTVPGVHIALMGIERLLPTMDDLALMLSLLPRSATGQKLSVYTNLLNSPRRPGEPDGPQERHLILVDNGRRAVQASAVREILYCIRCGACLNACPVFRKIGGHAYVDRNGKGSPYPGPIGSVISPALFGQFEYGHLARASSLCGACREACPVDIDLPRLLLRVRAGACTNQTAVKTRPNAPLPLAIGLKFFSLAASSPWRFALAQRLASALGSLATLVSKDGSWIRLPAISGWGFSRDFPKPATQSFRERYKKHFQSDTGSAMKASPAGIDQTPVAAQVQPALFQTETRKQIFANELTALGGHFDECTSENLAQVLLERLSKKGIDKMLAWDSAYLPEGLLEKLSAGGIDIHYPTSETLDVCSKIPAGITGAMAGIADTGSLVLIGGPGKPLTASLLPEMHIAILWEKDIVENLGQVLARQEVMQAAAGIVITGPSRTADIEMTLTIGVHGPGELHVICIH